MLKSDFGTYITVAVKAPKLCLLTQGSIVEFYEEAKTTIKLNHNNIVKCLGFSSESFELPCLIFEFMDCGSLEDVLATNRAKNLQERRILDLSNVSTRFKLGALTLKRVGVSK